MKKILTVSLFAIMAVGAANADIASTAYVDNKVSTAKTEIDGTVATLATKETVNGINTRVTTAEGKITTAEGKITAAEGKITTLEGKVSAMEGGDLAIGNGAVDTDQLASNSVTEAKLADNSVTEAKLATELANKINAAQTATQVGAAIDTKVTALNLANTYDAKGAASTAESNAKTYADGLNTAMGTRVGTAEGKITALESAGYQNADQVGDAIDDKIEALNLATTYEALNNKTQSVDENSTENQYPSAKAVYTAVNGLKGAISTENTERDTAILNAQTAAEAAQDTADDNAEAIEAHVANDDIHVTAAQKTAWNAKQAALSADQLSAVNSTATKTKIDQIATNTTNIANNATAISHKQGKSSTLSLGSTDGAWLDLKTIPGYSATGMYSLVMDGGNIKWEKVDTGTN